MAPDRAVGWKIGYAQKPYWVMSNGLFKDAPKFGYAGRWEDSWRMRPEKLEVERLKAENERLRREVSDTQEQLWDALAEIASLEQEINPA